MRSQQRFCPPLIGASNFSHSRTELRKAAHPFIPSLAAVDELGPCCSCCSDITIPCLWSSAEKSCSQQRLRAVPVLQVKGEASGETKRNVFALLFCLIAFHSQIPWCRKMTGYFKQHRSHKAEGEQLICCTAVFKPTHCTQSLAQTYFLMRVISVHIEWN